MKILGIVEQVLATAKDLGADIELDFIAGKNIAPCDGCESCIVTGKCKVKDDMQGIYPKLIEADGIVFGTPVYYWGMTAQAKILIDRTFIFRADKPLKNKIAGLVIVARRTGISQTFDALINYCYLQKMLVIGRVTAYSDKRGDVRQNKEAMDEAKELGRDMFQAIQRSGKIK
jgi:multimeric flavodoxin WrbA